MAILLALSVLAIAQPIDISPYDSRLLFVGRFDKRDKVGPKCDWSETSVAVRVKATKISAKFFEVGKDGILVEIDGKAKFSTQLKEGDNTIDVPLEPGEHLVRFVKRTEPFVGTLQFKGFQVQDGSIRSAKPLSRRIEIIGDSISCAFGIEGATQSEPFKPETENAYMGYGPVAARELKADCTIIAWSGRKMWPDNTTPELYDQALAKDASARWDYSQPNPDVIVINLATNDFGKENPEEVGWTNAYTQFITRLRKHYPKAFIYTAIGSMMSDNWPPKQMALTTLRGYLTRMVKRINTAGDKRVKVIEFPVQLQSDGIGSAWHPNLVTHKKMADLLAKEIRQNMRW